MGLQFYMRLGFLIPPWIGSSRSILSFGVKYITPHIPMDALDYNYPDLAGSMKHIIC
jgi:hypothetical protein